MFKSKNEFRYNKSTKHINYIFGQRKNRYLAVGLTSKNKTFGKKNMPLEKNPQKNKKAKSYIRTGIINNRIQSFSKHTDKRFKFSKNDFANVKSKIRNYKKHRK